MLAVPDAPLGPSGPGGPDGRHQLRGLRAGRPHAGQRQRGRHGTARHGTARLWQVRDPARARSAGEPLTGHEEPVNDVAFAPGRGDAGDRQCDSTVRLWDVADPVHAEPLGGELTGHLDTVTSVALSPDGRSLASAGYDLTARVWTPWTRTTPRDTSATAPAVSSPAPYGRSAYRNSATGKRAKRAGELGGVRAGQRLRGR
ncbi:hypothetical protein [Streptomyces sp. NPDC048248]|uniref:hypothetical protein n=1 Tax=Streptomyces sp. NPDC048248 TaxID=3365523 RepID=UPI00372180DF